MAKEAQYIQYRDIQGGRPEVTFNEDEQLWYIKHNYLKNPIIVKTHISPSERDPKTVVLLTDSGEYEFNVAELWFYEGGGCERESNINGGHPYDRERK